MMIHDLVSPVHKGRCILCDSSRDLERHRGLDQRASLGSEFYLRQQYLNKHLQHVSPWNSISCTRVYEEIHKLQELRRQILEELHIGCFSLIAVVPPFKEIYHPSNVAVELFRRGQGHTDCLGRTPLLQWLDSTNVEPTVEYWESMGLNIENVDQQDILGRSLLHVACQKKWKVAVELLLTHHADSYLTTAYGHLPLHYAAASGSAAICKMLISCGAKRHDSIDCYGNSRIILCHSQPGQSDTKVASFKCLSQPPKDWARPALSATTPQGHLRR